MAAYDEHTALIVVDVQNDFADPEGNLYVDEGEKVVPLINDEIAEAADAGATIVYTQDWHPGSTPHFTKDGGTWPVHCVQGTTGAELHPDLEVRGEVIRKGTGGEDGYSGFTVADPQSGEESATGLEDLLRERDIDKVVVVGLAGDVCVRATTLDAIDKGFETTVLREATRSVNMEPGDEERAFEEMAKAGAIVL